MALETVVFPQDLLGYYTMMDLCSLGGGVWPVWGYEFVGLEMDQDEKKKKDGGKGQQEGKGKAFVMDVEHCNPMVHNFEEWDVNSSSPETSCFFGGSFDGPEAVADPAAGRKKRRRTKKCKNKEEVENQRMNHIAVERNRRKQMNEYLGLLRSLMPASYVQRGDQASIVGGAINFVKELEQLLQSLEAQKRSKKQPEAATDDGSSSSSSSSSTTTITPFADFFTFPQYSTCSSTNSSTTAAAITSSNTDETATENRAAVADVEVAMVESHANLKVLMRQRPKQLLKMVVGLQNLHLTTLHLNVSTTADQMVLYSFSLKVEENCRLTSVDEIATTVYQLVGKIQNEAGAIN